MYKSNKITTVLFLLLIYFSACTKEEDFSDNQKVVAKLDELTDLLISQKKVPGLIISISAPQKGLFYLRAKGLADIAGNRPMNVNCLYKTGSLTKTFTGAILLQLIDERKVKLNDKINKYLPNLPYSDVITVKEILNMTSGVFEYSKDEYFITEFANNPKRKWDPVELVNIGLSHPLNFTPGLMWDYSSTNTIIAGLLIEKITGHSMKSEIETRIIKRYGLVNTFFPNESTMPNRLYCHGYDINLNGIEDVTEVYDPSYAWAAGSLITNVNDISLWLKLHLGSLFINPLLQAQRTNWVKINENDGYGLAIMKVGKGFVGHSGGLPGYSTISLYHQQSEATVIIMFNSISYNAEVDIPKAIDFFYTIQSIAFHEL